MPTTTLSATALAQNIRTGKVSARDALEERLALVAASTLNAVVHTDAKRARAKADALDKARADNPNALGQLHGVPMTLKDAWEVADMRSTGGAPALAKHLPNQSAEVAQRLERAGANIFGKTNTPFMSGDLQSFNKVYGTSENPWRKGHTPGGSSGGAAAAVATGLTALEIGSDIGGSIRTPAHFCGIFGLKPSWGLIPMRGHVPPPPGCLGESNLAVAGPLARTAEDLSLALGVVAGPMKAQATGWRLALPPARAKTPKDLRVLVWEDDPYCPTTQAITAATRRAGDALANAGARVESTKGFPLSGMTLEDVFEIYAMALHPITISGLPKATRARLVAAGEKTANDDRSHVGLMARAAAMHAHEALLWSERKAQLEARLANECFADYDVLLCPPTSRSAIPHDHSPDFMARVVDVDGQSRPYADMMIWIALATIAGLPAAIAPAGNNDAGLPVGVQIIGPRLEDTTVIAVAGMLESLGFAAATPPVLSSTS